MCSCDYIRDIFRLSLKQEKGYRLEFTKKLTDGKQGSVSLFYIMKNDVCQGEVISKTSSYYDYVIRNERKVMLSMEEISLFCPNFPRYVDFMDEYGDQNNITKIYGDTMSNNIVKDVLFSEYVNGKKLYKYTYDEHSDIVFSGIKQTLMAVMIAQDLVKFTHYDLHSMNIIMKKCHKSLSFLYVTKQGNFVIQSMGYYPVIIDYGYTYTTNNDDSYLWVTMSHTDTGYTPCKFDRVSDMRRLLYSTLSDFKDHDACSESVKKYEQIINETFRGYNVKIDKESGWLSDSSESASEYAFSHLLKSDNRSKFLSDHMHEFIDIVQSLIILPLENQNTLNTKKSYKTFVTEWLKIENIVSRKSNRLFCLCALVDIARDKRQIFLETDLRQKVVSEYKQEVMSRIDSKLKFCMFDDVNFENILSSLFDISVCLEGYMKNKLDYHDRKREEYNNKVPDIIDVYKKIDNCLPVNENKHVYKVGDPIVVVDSVNKRKFLIELNDKKDIQEINRKNKDKISTYLFELYNKTFSSTTLV